MSKTADQWLEEAERMEPASEPGTASSWPSVESIIARPADLPPLPPVLVEGVLRQGGKMILTGASKAGKSFSLIELAAALATGGKWLGMQCQPCRVLYFNLELRREMFLSRVAHVIEESSIDPEQVEENFNVWNLRGTVASMDDLIEHLGQADFDVLIVDPIYKLQQGDENSAGDIGALCRGLDSICERFGCTVVYAHHHSKGDKTTSSVIDRGSGSGVFARDADAILDLTELDFSDTGDGVSAWRCEFVLRDFAYREPLNLWWRYPRHLVDVTGELKGYKALSGAKSNTAAASAKRAEEVALRMIKDNDGEGILRSDLETALGASRNTVNGYIKRSDALSIDSLPSGAIIRRRK